MKGDKCSGVLNKDEEDELRLHGFAHCIAKKILFYFLALISGGTLLLLVGWKPRLRLSLMARKCGLASADIILVYVSIYFFLLPGIICQVISQDKYDVAHIEHTTRISGRLYFEHKKLKYFWNSKEDAFKQVCGDNGLTKKQIRSMSRGLTEVEAAQNSEHYGLNTIEVELRPVWSLIFDEVRNTFELKGTHRKAGFESFLCVPDVHSRRVDDPGLLPVCGLHLLVLRHFSGTARS